MEIIVFEKEAYYKMIAEIKKTIGEAFRDASMRLNTTTSTKEAEWVTIDRAKFVLKCGRDKLNTLRTNGDIVAVRDGRQVLYFEPSLFEHLARNAKRQER